MISRSSPTPHPYLPSLSCSPHLFTSPLTPLIPYPSSWHPSSSLLHHSPPLSLFPSLSSSCVLFFSSILFASFTFLFSSLSFLLHLPYSFHIATCSPFLLFSSITYSLFSPGSPPLTVLLTLLPSLSSLSFFCFLLFLSLFFPY